MFDFTINVPTLIAAALPVVAFIVWLVRLEGRVTTASADAKEASSELHEANVKIEAVRALTLVHKEQFHAYQLEAAEKFMTQAAVSEIKRDLLNELNKIEQRLEAQIDRLVTERVAP
jgi:hypothetical protein